MAGYGRTHAVLMAKRVRAVRQIGYKNTAMWSNETCELFFQWLHSPCWPWPLYFSFLICTRAVGLLERVISSSQGLYLNTRQHKHRKTHIHTIEHPCPQGGIRTRSDGLRAIEDCSCLRPLDYRDRPFSYSGG
jgi:hypothetical protein